MENTTIRLAEPEDAPALLAIYAPYVEKTAVTFEYEVPTREVFAERIRRTREKYPYLLAERDGDILGYAYAGPFHSRPAYAWSAESSIYVREDGKRQGIGRALYGALETALALQNILNLNACVACPGTEDEYLTRDSLRFHQRMGYRLVGQFTQCGYKFGRWYHMAWLEKHLGPHEGIPAPVKSLEEVRERLAGEYGIR